MLSVAIGDYAVADDGFLDAVQPIFRANCIRCHGQDGEVNGDVDLVAIENSSDLMRDPEMLRELIEAIRFRAMPPEDEPPLESSERETLLSSLESALHSVPPPRRLGQAPIRRMNRFQYNNAVTDLFQLNCVVFALPERMVREHQNYFRPETKAMADRVTVGSRPLGKSQLIEPRLAGVAPFPQDLRAEHGFDNRGDHLSLSPLLMESFLRLSQSITQSPDFDSRVVGIWDDFFAPLEVAQPIHQAVHERLKPFLTRAFRKPPDAALLDRYTSFVIGQLDRGDSFTDAMKSVAAATLASPQFLYLYDQANEGESLEPLSEWELASRLSFFLWSSIPDQELIELAAEGTLGDSDVLAGQVDRMLRDHKLKRFCDSFPAQWLQLERIISSTPDPEIFPDFYFSKYRASMHMMIEPLLLFETVLVENQPITQFIDSDFTYLSVRLREMYGNQWPGADRGKRSGGDVTTLTFDRIPVTDRRYGGMITNAAVMTMTSGSNRTQPITRGAWLLSTIFNDPPEPPPADVPPLAETPAEEAQDLTLRERLSQHRERADCRGCHEKIDPLGFALENYDPVGVWRDHFDNGREVDMAGVLFRTHPFTNVVEFKDALLDEKDRFTEAFSEHVLSFALARELGASDAESVETIARQTAADDYRIQTLIKQVVLSAPFRQKTNLPRPAAGNVHD